MSMLMVQAVREFLQDGDTEKLRKAYNSLTFATPEEIAAIRSYTGYKDDIEIDDEAETSEGEDGVWIQGWLWLPNEGDGV